MPHRLPILDICVLAAYMAGTVAFGCWFLRKSRRPEAFMVAGGAVPAWAVGLSIFGTYVSSISFLALPGKAFSGNWNPFVFSLALPLAAWAGSRWFVPFFRHDNTRPPQPSVVKNDPHDPPLHGVAHLLADRPDFAGHRADDADGRRSAPLLPRQAARGKKGRGGGGEAEAMARTRRERRPDSGCLAGRPGRLGARSRAETPAGRPHGFQHVAYLVRRGFNAQ
mgnify:CR=1 FL=1